MKKIFLFLLFPISSFAQKDTFYFQLIDTASGTKVELYARARQFVALQFHDSRNVIQMDDKDAGKIICKGVFTPLVGVGLGMKVQSIVYFTADIDLKDGKYRCVLSDFYHDGYLDHTDQQMGGNLNNEKPDCGTFRMSKKYWQRIKTESYSEARDFINSFKTAMTKKQSSSDF